jgi:6-phosphogluconolactonase
MLRQLVKIIGVVSAFAAASASAGDDGSWVYFGTRATGTGTGIVAAHLDECGKLTPVGLVSDIARPTWLSAHPKLSVMYAASDTGAVQSTLYSLAVDRKTGALTVKNNAPSGGIGATHLAVNHDLKSIFAAHFGSGQVSWLSLSNDGSLGALQSVQQQYGTGPHPRQASPHAHGVAVDPTERFLLANDFGADRIFSYRIDTESRLLQPTDAPFVSVPAGSGPRHSAFHPNGRFLFVVNELTAEVSSYRWEAGPGRLTHVQTLPMDEPTFPGPKSASHIQISRDGRFVYAANRGIHSMQVFEVNSWQGTLELIQTIPSGGLAPWDFSLDPTGRWLAVANNASNSIAVFTVNRYTGKLEATTETLSTPLPSNVTFMRADD